ncbi:MAG: MotA/TolQ/ExbB proton channel family protein [Desulfatiglandaceae bacterium]
MVYILLLIISVLIFLFSTGSMAGAISDMTNLKSCILVFGGTLICGFLAFPLKSFKGLLKSLHQVFRYEETDNKTLLFEIETLAHVRWLYGIKELEAETRQAKNPFLRKGIEFVVDDYSREEINEIMERDFDLYLSEKVSQVNILNTLAKLAPALGFVGTLIGLMGVFNHMQSPEEMGKGMSLALLTTLYGSLIAHVFFLPLAKKFSAHIRTEAIQLSIIKEGVLAISEKRNPKVISHRLQSDLGTHLLHDSTGFKTADPADRSRKRPFIPKWMIRKGSI